MSNDEPQVSRRQVLKGAGVLGGAVLLGGLGWRALTSGDDSGVADPPVPPELSDLADAITPGGPGIDGIPPIDEPRFVAASDATFPRDDDIVFGLELDGEHRAYPQLVLVWHEIVNDTVAGRPISVTYCPLTGTAVGFTGIPGEDVVSFGTSGNLVNSNLLMYDRPTGSRWPQILGTAIVGELAGTVLPTHPLVWTTWGRWRAAPRYGRADH